MTRFATLWTLAGGALLVGACGSDPNPPITLECSGVSPTSLAVGEYTILDASQTACVRLPAAGGAEVEHLYVALSAAGTESRAGTTAQYKLQAGAGATAAARASARGEPVFDRAPTTAQSFHDLLRTRERDLTSQPTVVQGSRRRIWASATATVPVVIGAQRTFEVCGNTDCTSFVQSTATAKVVGQRVAIFVDDAAPAGYTQADLDKVGQLFDDYLYPIDTTAFGREPDLDANGAVIVLLTPRVNELTPNCNSTGSAILGFFYGVDLLPSEPHSNDGEVFYGVVPGTITPGCTISKNFATGNLPGVFIHEFQHMISFNQHVLERGGPVEDTWLNEGLSHFAEELGGDGVPDSFCQPTFTNCETEFGGENIDNAYSYLNDPETNFLIEPSQSTGTLPERGANWLFVRWLADHFSATPANPTDLTRKLVQTNLTGAANAAAAAGDAFATLVSQWQLANYLESLEGFTASTPRLGYTTDLRTIFLLNFNNGVFAKPYPLTPDITNDGTYDRTGVLRAGSGRHLRVIQPASSGDVQLRLTEAAGAGALASSAAPRIALVRVR